MGLPQLQSGLGGGGSTDDSSDDIGTSFSGFNRDGGSGTSGETTGEGRTTNDPMGTDETGTGGSFNRDGGSGTAGETTGNGRTENESTDQWAVSGWEANADQNDEEVLSDLNKEPTKNAWEQGREARERHTTVVVRPGSDDSDGAHDRGLEARTDLTTGDGDDEMSWTEDNDEYVDDLPTPENIDYDLDGEPGGDLVDGPGFQEPDYDGDGEPGGNLTDINIDVPEIPGVPDTGDLLPWWAPLAVVGTIGTLLAVVVLWLVRPFVAAFATAR